MLDTFYAPGATVSTDDGKGTIILGQDADALGGGFDENQALSGSISDFHMWDRAINENEATVLSNCNNSGGEFVGNVIDWNDVNNWDNHNITITEVDNVCNHNTTSNFIVFNQRMNSDDITRHCNVLRGMLPYEFNDLGELRYYEDVLKLFEEEMKMSKSPCISNNGGVNDVKFWIGFKIKGVKLYYI